MTKTRRYRSVVLEAKPGKKLGEVHLAENERVVRQTSFFVEESQTVRCIITIMEKVDKAKEKRQKKVVPLQEPEEGSEMRIK